MKNIEFKEIKTNNHHIILRAKISDNISNLIRENTNCPKDRLEEYISNDNIFYYPIQSSIDFDIVEFQNIIENIANNIDEETFINHILKNDRKFTDPASMHNIMQEEYNLKEDDIEWYTSLFFISLGGLLTNPEFCYRSIEEDIEAGDCIVISIKRK